MAKKATADDKTLALIAEIKKQKAEIAKVDRPSWRTNCSFPFQEGSSSTVNIQVVSSVKDIIGIGALLLERKTHFERSALMLGVESPPDFTWSGFSLEDWMEDLKLRITKIQIATKRKKLEVLEERLNKIISPELRAQMELDDITKELGV